MFEIERERKEREMSRKEKMERKKRLNQLGEESDFLIGWGLKLIFIKSNCLKIKKRKLRRNPCFALKRSWASHYSLLEEI